MFGNWQAAERGGAQMVSPEYLFGYGPTDGRPMTDDRPLGATTSQVCESPL